MSNPLQRKSFDGKDKTNRNRQETPTSNIPDLERETAQNSQQHGRQSEISDPAEPQQNRSGENPDRRKSIETLIFALKDDNHKLRVDSNDSRQHTMDFSREFKMLLKKHQDRYSRKYLGRPLDSRRNSTRRRERPVDRMRSGIWKRTPTNPLRRRGMAANRDIVIETSNQIAQERGMSLLKLSSKSKLDHILSHRNTHTNAGRRERLRASMLPDARRRMFRSLERRGEATHRDIVVETSNQIAYERGWTLLKLPGQSKLDHILPRRPIRERVFMEDNNLDSGSETEAEQMAHGSDGDRTTDTSCIEAAYASYNRDIIGIPLHQVSTYVSTYALEPRIKNIEDHPTYPPDEKQKTIKSIKKTMYHLKGIESALSNISNNMGYFTNTYYRYNTFLAIKENLRSLAYHMHRIKSNSSPEAMAVKNIVNRLYSTIAQYT